MVAKFATGQAAKIVRNVHETKKKVVMYICIFFVALLCSFDSLVYFSDGGVGAFGAGVVYYVYHIERTPITNRRRYVTMTPKQLEKVHDFTSNHVCF